MGDYTEAESAFIDWLVGEGWEAGYDLVSSEDTTELVDDFLADHPEHKSDRRALYGFAKQDDEWSSVVKSSEQATLID